MARQNQKSSFIATGIKSVALAAALFAGVNTADAASILYETRAINNGVNDISYRWSWYNQTFAVTSNYISDFNGTTPGNNSFAHLKVEFTVNPVQNIVFQIAPDAGYGGALYLNGARVDHETSDLWWDYSFSASSELLQTGGTYAATTYSLEGFWAEGCCNGTQGGRFSIDGGRTWMALNVNNLNSLGSPKAVPEPGTMALFGLGIVGVGLVSRRKRKA